MAKKQTLEKIALTDAELENRAEKFKLKHFSSADERAEAQTFWNEFFNIFDIDRYSVSRFEKPTNRSLGKGRGFIDLFWKGKLIVEHKSASKNSEKDFETAFIQAKDYVDSLEKEEDKPKYVIICNFKQFRVHNLQSKQVELIKLENLSSNIKSFYFLREFVDKLEKDEEAVNQKAANMLGGLIRHVKQSGYPMDELQLFMTRILFCLFAEDTGIFKPKQFTQLIAFHTDPKGTDLGKVLCELFDVLNLSIKDRPANISAKLKDFPYVNGELFKQKHKKIPTLSINVRNELYNCCMFDWTPISPVIFGSLFQCVMDEDLRGDLGAHYTSEKNILKVIKPLFLNKLREELLDAKGDKKKLGTLRHKISQLRFLDPACGCGNFLIITYRELRLLDIEILKFLETNKEQAYMMDCVHLTNFYGIEYDSFSAYIAKVALWLMEHQLNQRLYESCHLQINTIPLKEAANIIVGNALRIDWLNAFPNMDYIFGNPPFLGKQLQNEEQKQDVELVFKGVQGAGVLDYVTCWYIKAAQYFQPKNEKPTASKAIKTPIINTQKAAFVSTNSISQGEQVGILWKELFEKYGVKILFAHQTFKWNNEAQGVAAVHCVIVGFGVNTKEKEEKFVYEYDDIKGEPKETKAKNINPYLVEGNDIWIEKRRKPICDVPEISFGSMPNDGGNFLFSDEEKDEFLKKEPNAQKFIKSLISAREYLNGQTKWCLWLRDILPSEIKELKLVKERIDNVKKLRNSSNRAATKKLSETPHLFGEIRQPNSDYIFVPLTSSENRGYIPFDLIKKDKIANNTVSIIPNGGYFIFGLLTSKMHMAWVKYVCGRLKSDYRYSNEVVYNNYPFPSDYSKEAKEKVIEKAENLIQIRKNYLNNGESYANLYDQTTFSMRTDLVTAHKELDKAVDACYGKATFKSDAQRIAFLFEEYERLVINVEKKVKNN